MSIINEKYIVDGSGKKIAVILEMTEYRKILQELEELDSIRAYDTAKDAKDKAISFDKAVSENEQNQQ